MAFPDIPGHSFLSLPFMYRQYVLVVFFFSCTYSAVIHSNVLVVVGMRMHFGKHNFFFFECPQARSGLRSNSDEGVQSGGTLQTTLSEMHTHAYDY